jgi:hypothetical protein
MRGNIIGTGTTTSSSKLARKFLSSTNSEYNRHDVDQTLGNNYLSKTHPMIYSLAGADGTYDCG